MIRLPLIWMRGCAVSVVINIFVGGHMHQLHGDGQRDDTAAIQALIDGKPVLSAQGSNLMRDGDAVALPAGMYRCGLLVLPDSVRLV